MSDFNDRLLCLGIFIFCLSVAAFLGTFTALAWRGELPEQKHCKGCCCQQQAEEIPTPAPVPEQINRVQEDSVEALFAPAP